MMERNTEQELYKFIKIKYRVGIINTRYEDVLQDFIIIYIYYYYLLYYVTVYVYSNITRITCYLLSVRL